MNQLFPLYQVSRLVHLAQAITPRFAPFFLSSGALKSGVSEAVSWVAYAQVQAACPFTLTEIKNLIRVRAAEYGDAIVGARRSHV